MEATPELLKTTFKEISTLELGLKTILLEEMEEEVEQDEFLDESDSVIIKNKDRVW